MRDRMRVVDAPDLAALPAIVQRGVISLVIVGASPADEALVLASVGEIRAIELDYLRKLQPKKGAKRP